MERQPNNPHDPNAIAIIGVATVFPFIGKPFEKAWHIGFIPAEWAEEVVRDLIDKNVAIAIESYSIYAGSDFYDIKFFVLAPKGYGIKARQNRQDIEG